jgi:hypothetical protein
VTILLRFLIALCLVGILSPRPALAYIDPVAGSVMLQVLIAGALGALFAFKQAGAAVKMTISRIWRRLTG